MIYEKILIIFLFILPFCLIILLFYYLKHSSKKNSNNINLDRIPPEGVAIFAYSSFRTYGYKQKMALGSNTFPSKKLVLYNSFIKFKVIFSFKKKYSDISLVNIHKNLLFKNIYNINFTFKNNIFGFSAYTKIDTVKKILVFLKQKNVPMTEESIKFLQN